MKNPRRIRRDAFVTKGDSTSSDPSAHEMLRYTPPVERVTITRAELDETIRVLTELMTPILGPNKEEVRVRAVKRLLRGAELLGRLKTK